jgi:hypothetical protein
VGAFDIGIIGAAVDREIASMMDSELVLIQVLVLAKIWTGVW